MVIVPVPLETCYKIRDKHERGYVGFPNYILPSIKRFYSEVQERHSFDAPYTRV